MDWNDFYKSLKSAHLDRLYLFTGPEEFTKREALNALRKTVLTPGLEVLNDTSLENCSAQQIIDCAETLPVMAERRIVVVRDWSPLKSGRGKDEENDVGRMLQWLKNPPESCILIFYMSVEMDGRKKFSAALKKLACHVEFNRLTGVVLAKWCKQQLRSEGKNIGQDALNELTLIAGQDLTRLSGELKKLCAYSGDNSEITLKDVRAIVSPSPEYSVFMILDHLLEGQLSEAFQIVNTVLETEPSIVRLISLLANQLRIDTHMKYALDNHNNMAEVLKILNVSEYRSRHILRQIRYLNEEDLKTWYLSCTEADYAIKSGRMRDRAALDMLMIKIAMSREATKLSSSSSKV